jgi:hypothetical protein
LEAGGVKTGALMVVEEFFPAKDGVGEVDGGGVEVVGFVSSSMTTKTPAKSRSQPPILFF